MSQEGYSYQTSFSESFYLDRSVQVDELVATVKDGVLVCSAPKDRSKLIENPRLIPITNLNALEVESRPEELELPSPPQDFVSPMENKQEGGDSSARKSDPHHAFTTANKNNKKNDLNLNLRVKKEATDKIMKNWEAEALLR